MLIKKKDVREAIEVTTERWLKILAAVDVKETSTAVAQSTCGFCELDSRLFDQRRCFDKSCPIQENDCICCEAWEVVRNYINGFPPNPREKNQAARALLKLMKWMDVSKATKQINAAIKEL